MTMKHDRDQETDEQRRSDGDADLADNKLGPIPMAWETALGVDESDEATGAEVARGEDLEEEKRD